MACDFWSKPLILRRLRDRFLFSVVHGRALESTEVMETFWRRPTWDRSSRASRWCDNAGGEAAMTLLTRITLDPDVMGGKPCIRGMRITVGTIVGLVASGRTVPEILAAYPYLEEADIREALAYAAWR